jgi:hypothetical protein
LRVNFLIKRAQQVARNAMLASTPWQKENNNAKNVLPVVTIHKWVAVMTTFVQHRRPVLWDVSIVFLACMGLKLGKYPKLPRVEIAPVANPAPRSVHLDWTNVCLARQEKQPMVWAKLVVNIVSQVLMRTNLVWSSAKVAKKVAIPPKLGVTMPLAMIV